MPRKAKERKGKGKERNLTVTKARMRIANKGGTQWQVGWFLMRTLIGAKVVRATDGVLCDYVLNSNNRIM